MSLSAARARRLYAPAVNGCIGRPRRSGDEGRALALRCVGFAVPSSMPRYTATESQLTISPLKRSASASEMAVFPLPVGPRTRTASGSGLACSDLYAPSSKAIRTATTPRERSSVGLVCTATTAQMTAARISKPNTWLRRNERCCRFARALARLVAGHAA
jgi:hypothetical protein